MKSIKEVSLESKILKRLENLPNCTKLVTYLFADEELQEMQDYANNVSIKRLGYNDHGPVHMRQVAGNAIKMLNLLKDANIKTSLETEEVGTFEDSMCALILAGLMHDLGMMIGRQGHEDMSALLAQPIIERTLMHVFPDRPRPAFKGVEEDGRFSEFDSFSGHFSILLSEARGLFHRSPGPTEYCRPCGLPDAPGSGIQWKV